MMREMGEKGLKKELEKVQARKKKKRKKWDMYEDVVGCSKSSKGVEYLERNAGSYASYYDKVRCDCTYTKTKRYSKSIEMIDLSVRDYNKRLDKFKDNNSHIKSEYYDTDRSW